MDTAPRFATFLQQAWDDHADAPGAVAERLQTHGVALLSGPHGGAHHAAADIAALATLAQHLWGDHLADAAAGRAVLQQLALLPACTGAAVSTVRRCDASLALCAGDSSGLQRASPSDRVRILAMAAASLAERDADQAGALLQQALDEAAHVAAQPGATDPLHRALAVAGNNIASSLEEKTDRSPAQLALMVLAAQAARTHWAIAGGWLETERAEYRLAMTWLQAGDAVRAQQHAQACLDIVNTHNGAALERFFAWEALARATAAQRGAHAAASADAALAQAEQAFTALPDDDRSWVAPSLVALRTACAMGAAAQHPRA